VAWGCISSSLTRLGLVILGCDWSLWAAHTTNKQTLWRLTLTGGCRYISRRRQLCHIYEFFNRRIDKNWCPLDTSYYGKGVSLLNYCIRILYAGLWGRSCDQWSNKLGRKDCLHSLALNTLDSGGVIQRYDWDWSLQVLHLCPGNCPEERKLSKASVICLSFYATQYLNRMSIWYQPMP